MTNAEWLAANPQTDNLLTDDELAELFPDPTLIGNRVAALTTALGIPPCGGCGQRQAWLNGAHAWLRDHFTAA